jgi:RNA polymerase sigma-70 factor (ECF subfamily)
MRYAVLVASDMAVPPSEAKPQTQAIGSFDAVFRAHYARVVRWVRALGIAATETDDVAQEVFLIAHRRRDQLADGASVRGWLFSITRRTCANARRGRAREEARREHADEPAAVPDPEAVAGRRQAAEILQGFLDSLPDEQREAFVLYEIEGMKAPEAAKSLGVSPDTVHSRVRLAREKLARVVTRHRARIEGGQHG